MWVLLWMACAGLDCGEIEVRGNFETAAECEAAMESLELKQGEALVCMKAREG